MRYEDTVEKSTEYLRMAIPQMAKQEAALHPVSYAVWYEYVSNRSTAVKASVDEHLKRDGRLDEASTWAIFRQHIAEIDPQTAQRVTDGFNQILSGMAESAARAGDQTARFESSLERLSSQIVQSSVAQDAAALREILEETREMSSSMNSLQQRLEESQQEIVALRDAVRKARHESMLDALTGLANRRAFDQRMAAYLAALESGATEPACLLVSDIDHFKKINDTFGHGFGDQVLRAVAQVLKQAVPGDGLAARIGGEEFAILLPPMPVDRAQTLAERIRTAVASSRIRRQGTEETIARVTISLGLAVHKLGEGMREFIERADQALYASKRAGRDRVTVAAFA